jgi:hypothetical protein
VSSKYPKIEAIANGRQSVEFDCRGFAHDGDRFRLSSVHQCLEKALIQFQSHLVNSFYFTVLMESRDDVSCFDILQMLKNNRMQTIQRNRVLFPCVGSVVIASDTYGFPGSIPSEAFKESPSVPMDDHVAERLFDSLALVESRSKPQFFVTMFRGPPWILL